MQTAHDTERKFRFTIHPSDKKVRTKLEHTMAQAEEINDSVTESARQALDYDDIVPLRNRSKTK